MHTARMVVLLALFSCAAAAARAQYPQRRDGFWIGFGLGYGSANIRGDNCVDSSSVGGITGFVKLGGAPRRHLLLRGGAHRSGGAQPGGPETNRHITPSRYPVPRPRGRPFATT